MTAYKKNRAQHLRQHLKLYLLGAALIFSGTSAGAQETLRSAMGKCASISENGARLACYDALHARVAADGDEGSRNEQANNKTSDEKAEDKDLFGFKPKAEPSQLDDERVMIVAKAEKHPRGQWTIRMENGQIWKQVDSKRVPTPKAGLEATIKNASFGTYFVIIDGTSLRAKRIQ